MQERVLGASGLRVSRLGLGLMTWGGATDEHVAREQLTAFVAAGGTLLDTAHVYSGGASEELLGSLLREFPRDELVIATKGGFGYGRSGRVADTSRRGLLTHLDTSLRRLGVDHVDLWQVHVWSDSAPLEETLAALDTAVATGRASYVGISNWSGWRTAQAATWQRSAPGRAPLVSTQVEYSLLNRSVEHEIVPAAQELGLGLLPWSPLGRGVLTGKYRSGTPSDSRGASEMSAFVDPYRDESSSQVVEAVVRAAEGLGWTPVEVALAWVRDRPGVTAPIVGARTTAQLQAALASEERTLPPELTQALDDVSEGR
ncbi:aldo/keto reductase [Nocardioides flavescens]|uniref:Aldo/keto reductase n=1 Tax=Nocardioides flavescens TaxID=2691959 RepID=A0A6L7EZ33_9ACTN|nr:aldo/keto reductase [Nocardioides flavescens]MXG88822.1 aldo/keto reductase [Nocardioides flavescens]